MNSERRSFYNEMDQSHKQKKEKTLSFWKLTLFFLILIIALEALLFSFGKAIKNSPDIGLSVKGLTSQGVGLVSSKETGDEIEIIISQGLLCSRIVESLKKEVSCSIDKEGVVVTGKVSSFLPGNSAVYLMPKAEGGKIKFDIEKVTIGSIEISSFIASPVSSALAKAVSSTLPGGAEVKRIDLLPASMVVITSKK